MEAMTYQDQVKAVKDEFMENAYGDEGRSMGGAVQRYDMVTPETDNRKPPPLKKEPLGALEQFTQPDASQPRNVMTTPSTAATVSPGRMSTEYAEQEEWRQMGQSHSAHKRGADKARLETGSGLPPLEITTPDLSIGNSKVLFGMMLVDACTMCAKLSPPSLDLKTMKELADATVDTIQLQVHPIWR